MANERAVLSDIKLMNKLRKKLRRQLRLARAADVAKFCQMVEVPPLSTELAIELYCRDQPYKVLTHKFAYSKPQLERFLEPFWRKVEASLLVGCAFDDYKKEVFKRIFLMFALSLVLDKSFKIIHAILC